MEDDYICTLTEKALADCRTQLNETDDLREQSVKIISSWLNTEKKLNAKTGILYFNPLNLPPTFLRDLHLQIVSVIILLIAL
jgi:arginine utilization protein RocB